MGTLQSLFKRLFARSPMARSTRAYDFALRHLSLPPAPRVLDIGTGQGYGAAFLSRRLPNAYVVSLDISFSCFSWEKLDVGPRHPALLQANAPYLPLAPHSFDAVFAIMTFHCLPEPQRVLSEAARVLRPNGTLVIADVDGHHWMARPFEVVEHRFISRLTRAYTPETLTSMLTHAGFRQVDIRKRPGKERGFMMWVFATR